MNTPAQIVAAEKAGREAYKRGDRCMPHQDPALCGKDGLLNTTKFGEGLPTLNA